MSADPPRLPAEISAYGASILTQWRNVQGFLNELQSLAGDDRRFQPAIAGIKSAGIFIGEDCAKLKAAVDAAKICGYIAAPVRAEDLELHPRATAPSRPYHDRMLDAAGDHTLEDKD